MRLCQLLLPVLCILRNSEARGIHHKHDMKAKYDSLESQMNVLRSKEMELHANTASMVKVSEKTISDLRGIEQRDGEAITGIARHAITGLRTISGDVGKMFKITP